MPTTPNPSADAGRGGKWASGNSADMGEAMDEPEMVTVDRRELLRLLDHVESLVRYCSVAMPDVPRYYAGANALWAVVWRLAGDDEKADKLAAEVPEVAR